MNVCVVLKMSGKCDMLCLLSQGDLVGIGEKHD
jgi:hypothetical protein